MDFIGLIPFAETEKQKEYLEACHTEGNMSRAATKLELTPRTVQMGVRRIADRARSRGFDPAIGLLKPTTGGLGFKGASVLTKVQDEDSDVVLVWNKYENTKAQQLEAVREAFLLAFEDYKGASTKIAAPKQVMKDIITMYPMGDPHIGMYAWADECGEDFNCDIAEANLKKAVDILIERSPAAHTAILLNLGDFFHGDSHGNTTTKGTNVDVDTRWSRVLRIGVNLMIYCITAALKKHKQVIVRNVIGNHDDHTSQALSVALACFFSNNPRVRIDESASHFWYYQFGKVLIGSTHGDMAKPDKLEGIMATDKAVAWGETLHRYWLTGHIHTQNVKEYTGCVWESFRTLAAKDAWHSAMGYRGGRDMKSIIYHKDHGEVERHTMNISMLRGK